MNLSGLRILLVEDQAISRRFCGLMLASLGGRAETANDGRAALERIGTDRFDVILMDCHMPEMDGYQATTAIRQIEAARPHRTRIIALTANTDERERERCRAAGMDDFLTKPFTTEQLKQVLLPALRQNGSSAAPTNAQRDQLFAEGDREAVLSMIADFASELPARFEKIIQLADAGALPELEAATHALKGVSASFGLEPLADALHTVEQDAISRDPARARKSSAALPQQVTAALAELQEWLASRRAQPDSTT